MSADEMLVFAYALIAALVGALATVILMWVRDNHGRRITAVEADIAVIQDEVKSHGELLAAQVEHNKHTRQMLEIVKNWNANVG